MSESETIEAALNNFLLGLEYNKSSYLQRKTLENVLIKYEYYDSNKYTKKPFSSSKDFLFIIYSILKCFDMYDQFDEINKQSIMKYLNRIKTVYNLNLGKLIESFYFPKFNDDYTNKISQFNTDLKSILKNIKLFERITLSQPNLFLINDNQIFTKNIKSILKSKSKKRDTSRMHNKIKKRGREEEEEEKIKQNEKRMSEPTVKKINIDESKKSTEKGHNKNPDEKKIEKVSASSLPVVLEKRDEEEEEEEKEKKKKLKTNQDLTSQYENKNIVTENDKEKGNTTEKEKTSMDDEMTKNTEKRKMNDYNKNSKSEKKEYKKSKPESNIEKESKYVSDSDPHNSISKDTNTQPMAQSSSGRKRILSDNTHENVEMTIRDKKKSKSAEDEIKIYPH